MGSSRTTQGKWRDHVRAWKASGLSSREYARQAGINANTLSWWRWRLAKDKGGRRPGRRRTAARADFFEVCAPLVELSRPDTGQLELEVAGVVVRLPSDFDAAVLDRLLGVLEAHR